MWERGMAHFFFHTNYPIIEYHLLKTLSFPHWITSKPLLKISWPYIYVGLFLDFILFHWFICLYLPQYNTTLTLISHCLDYYSFTINLETVYANPSTLFFSFSRLVGHLEILCISIIIIDPSWQFLQKSLLGFGLRFL